MANANVALPHDFVEQCIKNDLISVLKKARRKLMGLSINDRETWDILTEIDAVLDEAEYD